MRFRFSVLAFLGLAGFTVTHLGRELLAAYVWDKALRFASPILDPVFEAIIVYGPPVIFVGAAFYFAAEPPARRQVKNWILERVNIYLAIAALFGACCVIAICMYFYDRARGPIVWRWDESSPMSIGRSGEKFGVWNLQIEGLNRSDAPISTMRAYIRSNKTGQIVELLFVTSEGPKPPSRIIIPAHEKFLLQGIISKDGLLSVEEFTKEFGSFLFYFEYDGERRYRRNFSESDVQSILDFGIGRLKKLYQEQLEREKANSHGVIVKPD